MNNVISSEFEKCFSAHFSFWEHISDSEKKLLCEKTKNASFKKGQTIHNSGDDCLGIMLIRKGQLRVYMISSDGREITLYRLFGGDTCILSASCVIDAISFDVFIDAEDDTDVLMTCAKAFSYLSEHNIYVEAFSYKLATLRFSKVMWAMQQILFMSMDQRLAVFLLDECEKTGSETIRLTHEQIARYMGSAREVVTRMLKYFSDENIVTLSRGVVKIVDKVRLKEYTKE